MFSVSLYRLLFCGIYDMTDNVRGWVSDRYDADCCSLSPEKNPEGAGLIDVTRVLRGGSWDNTPEMPNGFSGWIVYAKGGDILQRETSKMTIKKNSFFTALIISVYIFLNACGGHSQKTERRILTEPGTAITGNAKFSDEINFLKKQSNLKACGIGGSGHFCKKTLEDKEPASFQLIGFVCHDSGKTGIKVNNCQEYYDVLREIIPVRRIDSSEFFVETAPGLLISNNKAILDMAQGSCRNIMCETDQVYESAELLSFVGPVITFYTERADAVGGGYLGHLQKWYTYDLRHNVPANILEIVEEESLVQALKQDTWINSQLQPEQREQLKNLKTFESIRRLAIQCCTVGDSYPLAADSFLDFAFFNYDDEKQLAAVRLSFYPVGTDSFAGPVSQLGILVKPQKKYIKYFEQAQKGKGFFISSTGLKRKIN